MLNFHFATLPLSSQLRYNELCTVTKINLARSFNMTAANFRQDNNYLTTNYFEQPTKQKLKQQLNHCSC